MKSFSTCEQTIEFIESALGHEWRLATPLGLGKPNRLLNSLYAHARTHPQCRLSIHTALSLNPPSPKPELAKKFFDPFKQRHWGDNYPELHYFRDASKNSLPSNVTVSEFYFQAGAALGSTHLQRHYQSVNYTYVAENLLRENINVVIQLVAKRVEGQSSRYSLSCNPDVTLDLSDLYRQHDRNFLMIGVVHPDLPFLQGEAEVEEKFFDAILEEKAQDAQLFALPRMPISVEDHWIGLYSSLFVKDGGTLQIGIGSLSDAIVASLKLRQENNSEFLRVFKTIERRLHLQAPHFEPQTDVFERGLYGLTEMLTDGFMHLRRLNILKREVVDETTGQKTFVHGSFYLGSKDFYEWLRNLPSADASGLRMTRVSKVNDLYDPRESLLRQQRVHGRFFNTTMQVTLFGAAMSETLSDAQVVSGVGGQYNFVAMANELKGAKSVLMLRSYRINARGKAVSNIVWDGGHLTIPRHCRDCVVTEYGIADLKGRSDEQCIQAMLNIVDSRFQQSLLKAAKKSGKLARDYQIPEEFLNNTPEFIRSRKAEFLSRGHFHEFPFGSDFTKEEERIVLALEALQFAQKQNKLALILTVLKPSESAAGFQAELKRMGLDRPRGFKDRIYRKLLLHFLQP